MPYSYEKSGGKVRVFKKDSGETVGHTTPEKLHAYLAALHIHEGMTDSEKKTDKKYHSR
jgi:Cu/Zn superoxide dismutase